MRSTPGARNSAEGFVFEKAYEKRFSVVV